MKRSFLIIVCIAFAFAAFAQSGKYAGSMKKLIGKTYSDSMPALKTWKFRSGSIVSPLTDPTWFFVDVYQKGSTYIVFFSLLEDTSGTARQILDVVEIKSVKPGWEIKTSLCREYKQENVFIVGLANPGNEEYSKMVSKAWRFNRDKIRFEWINPKNVDCMNEGS